MNRILTIISAILALNFIVAVGFVAWLRQSGKLDAARVAAIREIVFAPTTQPAVTHSSEEPATRPALKLNDVLGKYTGHSAAEQIEFIQHTFDAKMAQLDRRERELADLQRQVQIAKDQLTRDRVALDTQRDQLTRDRQLADRLLSDKGFQDTLQLYTSMPPRQVKTIFMSLDEQTLVNYLQAMPPRTATKIIKEFKTPEETERIQKALERMRQAQASAKPAKE